MTAHTRFEGRDDEYPACPRCGQTWKVAHRAHAPSAVPVDPPNGDRPTYKVTGCTSTITKHLDHEDDTVLLLSWPCDGHLMTVAMPAFDLVPCLAGPDGSACRGGQPLDSRQAWSFVHQCRCCHNHGTHYVRRDGTQPPACRSMTKEMTL